jgi:superfamily II DNA or RNA helicase
VFDIQDPNWYSQFDFVIVDEAHLAKGKSITHIMTSMTNARYRIGLTGTIDDVLIHHLQLEGLFGHQSVMTTTKHLMDTGQVSNLQIKCIILKHPTLDCTRLAHYAQFVADKAEAYQEEMNVLVASKARNDFIRNLVLSLKNNTLLLFQYVEKHGKVLYEDIARHTDKDRVHFVYGGTDAEDREKVRTIVESSSNAIIVASYGVFSTGVSIRNLHNLIFASPSKSKIRVLQSIGRSLRLADNKTHATLFDIADDLRSDDKWINYTLRHYEERMKLYDTEGFNTKKYYVNLQGETHEADQRTETDTSQE